VTDEKTPRTREGVFLPTKTNKTGELVHGILVDENGPSFRELRKAKEGDPIDEGEIVELGPRDDGPALNAKVRDFRTSEKDTSHKGPARANNPDFKDGWERIWGGPVGEA
jgi:hypothetical protein